MAQKEKPRTKQKSILIAKQKKIRVMKGLTPTPTLSKVIKSHYSEIMSDLICSRIADGESLKSICNTDGFPSVSTVIDWAKYPDENLRPGFQSKYLKAKELSYHLMAEQIIDIADDSGKDKKKIMMRGREIEVIDHENINRDRLRVDSRKFILSKALPKIYGDKLEIEHTGSVDLVGRLAAGRRRIAEQAAEGKILEAQVESVMITDGE